MTPHSPLSYLPQARTERDLVLLQAEVAALREHLSTLEVENRRLRMLGESAGDRIAYWDRDMRLCWANRGFCARFGVALDRVIGQHVLQIIPRERYLQMRGEIELALRGQPRSFDHVATDQVAGQQWELIHLHPDFRDGEVVGVCSRASDVTARRMAEDALRRNAELEQGLLEAADLARSARQSLDEFAHAVSHDLRAPVRHVKGFITLLDEHLKAEPQDEETRDHYLEVIGGAAFSMDQMIDGLLRYARLASLPVRRARVDCDAIVDGWHAAWRERHGERRIELRVNALPLVRGEPTLLREVWHILLDNAAKFHGPGEDPRIEVGLIESPAQAHEGSADADLFFVRDNGIGFDPAQATSLFGVFRRLHNAKTFEGLGLGLALARRIVERHGGRVWAEGRPGVGSTFYFLLPRANT